MKALEILSNVFKNVQAARNGLYEKGLAPVYKNEKVKIICVGNIAVGGRGKSPLAMFVACEFQKRGVPTALLSRGYKGGLEYKGGLVSSGEGPLVSAAMCGDEAWQAAHMCRGVVVRVGADRAKQVRKAQAQGIKVVVLDDGFQHRKLFRDLDVVCVDPDDVQDGAMLLPSGHLREGREALERAHLTAGNSLRWQGKRNPPDILFSYKPQFIMDFDGMRELDGSLPRKAHLVCGIARPELFEQTVEAAGVKISSSTFFGDHHKFTNAEIQAVVREAQECGASAIITTTKDMARFQQFPVDFPLVALGIGVKIDTGNDLLKNALNSMV